MATARPRLRAQRPCRPPARARRPRAVEAAPAESSTSARSRRRFGAGAVAGRGSPLALARAKALAVSRAAARGAGDRRRPDPRRSAASASPSRRRSRRGARQLHAPVAARTHALHSAFALAPGRARSSAPCVARRVSTMRDSPDARSTPISPRAGDAVLGSVGGYQLEGPGVHSVRADRGRPFHHPRPAAPAAARFLAAQGADRELTDARTRLRHRLSGHAIPARR